VSIVKYLTTAGIAAERLSAAGLGEHRPVAPNDSRAGRAKNRRAEILLLFPDTPEGAATAVAAGRAMTATPVAGASPRQNVVIAPLVPVMPAPVRPAPSPTPSVGRFPAAQEHP
jgi:hypothetical protein